MAKKDLTGTTPKISKGSGSQSATGGFKNRGKGHVVESAGFSSSPNFSKGGKTKGKEGHKTFG